MVEILNRLGAEFIIKNLNVGEFLVGEDVAVLRKTIHNLVGTLTKRFFFDKLFKTKENVFLSLVLIERCMEFIRKFLRISLESLNDALFAFIQSNIPVVPTIDYKDTTIFLVTTAKQLLKEGREIAVIRHRFRSKNIKNKRFYAVTKLPCVDSELADNIIKKRVHVRTVFCSTKEEFFEVNGIGSLITCGIVEIIDAPYEEDKAKERILSTDEQE